MKVSWKAVLITAFVATLAIFAASSSILAGGFPHPDGYVIDCDEVPFGSNSSRICTPEPNLCNGRCCVGQDDSCDGRGGGAGAAGCQCDEACVGIGDCCSDFDSNDCPVP